MYEVYNIFDCQLIWDVRWPAALVILAESARNLRHSATVAPALVRYHLNNKYIVFTIRITPSWPSVQNALIILHFEIYRGIHVHWNCPKPQRFKSPHDQDLRTFSKTSQHNFERRRRKSFGRVGSKLAPLHHWHACCGANWFTASMRFDSQLWCDLILMWFDLADAIWST